MRFDRPNGDVEWFCDRCLAWTCSGKPILANDRVKLAAHGLLADIVPAQGVGARHRKG